MRLGAGSGSAADDEADIGCRRGVYAVLAAMLAAMLAVPALAGFTVDFASFWPVTMLTAFFAVFVPYAHWRGLAPMVHILLLSALGVLSTLPILVLTYGAMATGFPLADGALIAMDRALGFDWPAFVRLVDRSPLASAILGYSYASFTVQLFALPILLCVAGRAGRAYRLLAAYMLLCAAAALIAVPFPALGAYAAYGIDQADMANINTHFGYFFLESFHMIRGGESVVLTLYDAAGIITFPSVHVGVAVLCAWAAWSLRWLGPPVALLNVLMAISAMSHGSHYLVDILAGAAIAPLAIRAADRITAFFRGRTGSATPATPAPALA